MNELKEWQKETIQRLEEQEEKAYTRRQLADEAILSLLSDIYTQKTEPTDSKIFFQLRQAFQEYETAEERCCVTTDRLSEFHQRTAI
jgi:hypothetical protein